MDYADFMELKKKISLVKEKKDKAVGVIDSAMEELKELGINSIEDGKNRIEEEQEEIEVLEKKQEKIYDSLENLVDWDKFDEA